MIEVSSITIESAGNEKVKFEGPLKSISWRYFSFVYRDRRQIMWKVSEFILFNVLSTRTYNKILEASFNMAWNSLYAWIILTMNSDCIGFFCDFIFYIVKAYVKVNNEIERILWVNSIIGVRASKPKKHIFNQYLPLIAIEEPL